MTVPGLDYGDDRPHNGLGNGLGTPFMDATTAHDPMARDDVPPMCMPGMPLYDPTAHYWTGKDADKGTVVEGEVVDPKGIESGTSKSPAKTGK